MNKQFYHFCVIDYNDNSRIIYYFESMPIMISFVKYVYKYLRDDINGIGCFDYDNKRHKSNNDTEYCFYIGDVDLPTIDNDYNITYKELYFDLSKI